MDLLLYQNCVLKKYCMRKYGDCSIHLESLRWWLSSRKLLIIKKSVYCYLRLSQLSPSSPNVVVLQCTSSDLKPKKVMCCSMYRKDFRCPPTTKQKIYFILIILENSFFKFYHCKLYKPVYSIRLVKISFTKCLPSINTL